MGKARGSGQGGVVTWEGMGEWSRRCGDMGKAWGSGQGGVVTWGRHGGVVKEVQ